MDFYQKKKKRQIFGENLSLYSLSHSPFLQLSKIIDALVLEQKNTVEEKNWYGEI